MVVIYSVNHVEPINIFCGEDAVIDWCFIYEAVEPILMICGT
jgi:hypothetical protein